VVNRAIIRSSLKRSGNLLLKSLEFHNREIRIDCCKRHPHKFLQIIHGPLGLQDEGAGVH